MEQIKKEADILNESKALCSPISDDNCNVSPVAATCEPTMPHNVTKISQIEKTSNNTANNTKNSNNTNNNTTTTVSAAITTSNNIVNNNGIKKEVDSRDSGIIAELKWTPGVPDCDLMMYLRAARSMAAFAGMCNGGSADDGYTAACRDDTTINALELLNECSYDIGKALQALVKNPIPKGLEKIWTDDEQKRFIRGMKKEGKNFFNIKNEFLPHKSVSELVEFYYLTKMTTPFPGTKLKRRRNAPSKSKQTKSLIKREPVDDGNRDGECPSSDESDEGSNDMNDENSKTAIQDNSQDSNADLMATSNISTDDNASRPEQTILSTSSDWDQQHQQLSSSPTPSSQPPPSKPTLACQPPSSPTPASQPPPSKPTLASQPTSKPTLSSQPTPSPISASQPPSSPILASQLPSSPIPTSRPPSSPISANRPPSLPTLASQPPSLPILVNQPPIPPPQIPTTPGQPGTATLTGNLAGQLPQVPRDKVESLHPKSLPSLPPLPMDPTSSLIHSFPMNPQLSQQARSIYDNPAFSNFKHSPGDLSRSHTAFSPAGQFPPVSPYSPAAFLPSSALSPASAFSGLPGFPPGAVPPGFPSPVSAAVANFPARSTPTSMPSSTTQNSNSSIQSSNKFRTSKAIFTKVVHRPDQITCMRTDWTYKPIHNDAEWVKKLNERKKKNCEKDDHKRASNEQQRETSLQQQQKQQHQAQSHPSGGGAPPPPSSSNSLPHHHTQQQPLRDRSEPPPPGPLPPMPHPPDPANILHSFPSPLDRHHQQQPRLYDSPAFGFRHSPGDLTRPHTAFSPRGTPTSMPSALPGFQGPNGMPSLQGIPMDFLQYHINLMQANNIREQEERDKRDLDMRRFAEINAQIELSRQLMARHQGFPGQGGANNLPPPGVLNNPAGPGSGLPGSLPPFLFPGGFQNPFTDRLLQERLSAESMLRLQMAGGHCADLNSAHAAAMAQLGQLGNPGGDSQGGAGGLGIPPPPHNQSEGANPGPPNPLIPPGFPNAGPRPMFQGRDLFLRPGLHESAALAHQLNLQDSQRAAEIARQYYNQNF